MDTNQLASLITHLSIANAMAAKAIEQLAECRIILNHAADAETLRRQAELNACITPEPLPSHR